MRPTNLPAQDNGASGIYAMHLKNRFRDIQSDRDHLIPILVDQNL